MTEEQDQTLQLLVNANKMTLTSRIEQNSEDDIDEENGEEIDEEVDRNQEELKESEEYSSDKGLDPI